MLEDSDEDVADKIIRKHSKMKFRPKTPAKTISYEEPLKLQTRPTLDLNIKPTEPDTHYSDKSDAEREIYYQHIPPDKPKQLKKPTMIDIHPADPKPKLASKNAISRKGRLPAFTDSSSEDDIAHTKKAGGRSSSLSVFRAKKPVSQRKKRSQSRIERPKLAYSDETDPEEILDGYLQDVSSRRIK